MLVAGCSAPGGQHPRVRVETTAGDIIMEVYPDKAPLTANAFLAHVDAGYYHHGSFYRVLKDDNQPSNAVKANLIQGGIWKTNYKLASSLPGIPHEPTSKTQLSHTDRMVSMSRMEPGTAATEFFICIGDQPGFDFGGDNNPDGQGYAVFGKVIDGMQTVYHIFNRHSFEQSIDPPVVIISIVRE